MPKPGLILITDDSKIVVRSLQKALEKAGYTTITAQDGRECLDKIRDHAPDLVFLDIMLPRLHGIQVLRTLRQNPPEKEIGVIVSTGRALLQDYQSAIDNGADYYLTKPFKGNQVVELADRYFCGELSPAPFTLTKDERENEPLEIYEPTVKQPTTYAKFWGTRGSIPVSGMDYFRYGGNTSCLEVRTEDHLVIIDAGTGIRELGMDILTRDDVTEIHLIVGHTHWDHIMGFPFFAPVYNPKYNIKVYAAKGFHKPLKELFSGMLEHDYFPVRLDEMQANFEFIELDGMDSLVFGDLTVSYHYANHPGSTLCFKLQSKNKTVGYATDNELFLGYHGSPNLITMQDSIINPYLGMIDFYSGCDVLVHEAQYTPNEYHNKVGWGHSSVSNTAAFVKLTGVPEWIATHHDPVHSDAFLLDKLALHRTVLEECEIPCRPFLAYDKQVLPL